MKDRIYKLIFDLQDEYLHEVIEDEYEICQSASVDIELGYLTEETLSRVSHILEDCGIMYWLFDKPRFNPHRRYKLWIAKVKGCDPVWGITPIHEEDEV